MRKNIDLSEHTIKKLKKLADLTGAKLKPYIETVLIKHAAEYNEITPKKMMR
jgi:hypothetical protein